MEKMTEWQGLFRLLAVVACVWMLAACAGPTVAYQRIEPAEIDLKGVKRIAINKVYGPGAEVIREYVVNAIVESQKFELDEIGQADGFLTVRVLKYQCSDQRGTKKVKEMRGTGKYHKVEERRYGLFGPKELVDKEIMEEVWVTKPYVIRSAVVKVSFNFTRIDGTILATKVEEATYKKEAVGQDEINSLPLKDEILSDLTRQVISRLMARIVPHVVTETRILDYGDCLAAGNKAAQAGDWETALELYQPCTASPKSAAGAYFNMGVAYEASGQFRKAVAMYKKAAKLNPCTKYSDALVRVKKAVADMERLKRTLRR